MKTRTDATHTRDKEKIAIWIEHAPLTALRDIEKTDGRPVSESIRRAINLYLSQQK